MKIFIFDGFMQIAVDGKMSGLNIVCGVDVAPYCYG